MSGLIWNGTGDDLLSSLTGIQLLGFRQPGLFRLFRPKKPTPKNGRTDKKTSIKPKALVNTTSWNTTACKTSDGRGLTLAGLNLLPLLFNRSIVDWRFSGRWSISRYYPHFPPFMNIGMRTKKPSEVQLPSRLFGLLWKSLFPPLKRLSERSHNKIYWASTFRSFLIKS